MKTYMVKLDAWQMRQYQNFMQHSMIFLQWDDYSDDEMELVEDLFIVEFLDATAPGKYAILTFEGGAESEMIFEAAIIERYVMESPDDFVRQAVRANAGFPTMAELEQMGFHTEDFDGDTKELIEKGYLMPRDRQRGRR